MGNVHRIVKYASLLSLSHHIVIGGKAESLCSYQCLILPLWVMVHWLQAIGLMASTCPTAMVCAHTPHKDLGSSGAHLTMPVFSN